MLSTSKLIGIAAVALAATFVATIPSEPATDPLPAAATVENPAAVPISGRMIVLTQDRQGTREEHAYGRAYMGELWTTSFKVDDPRLDGKARSRHNRYTLPGTPYGPRSLTIWLENDGGSWVGEGRAYQDPQTTGIHYQILMEGQGGYEGLSAIIALDQAGFNVAFDVSGVILPGSLPEMPAPAPTEFVPTGSEG